MIAGQSAATAACVLPEALIVTVPPDCDTLTMPPPTISIEPVVPFTCVTTDEPPPALIVMLLAAVDTVTFDPATIDGVPVMPLTETTFATLVRFVMSDATWL